MNRKIMALMASMLAFTFVAKADNLMDLAVKAHTNVWGSRYMYSKEAHVATVAADKVPEKVTDDKEYGYADGAMAGFVNGNYGLTVDGIFNLGYGFGLGIGAGCYFNFVAPSKITYNVYDKEGKAVDNQKKDEYKAADEREAALLSKSCHMTIVPQVVLKYTFVELEPVSFYAIARAGYAIPMLFSGTKYDSKDGEKASLSWMDYHGSAGLGINWIGIELSLMYTRNTATWTTVQSADAHTLDANGKATTVVTSYKNSQYVEGMKQQGLTLEVGYNFGGLF